MKIKRIKYLIALYLAAAGLSHAEWQILPEMPTARSGACAIELEGWIYVIGGRHEDEYLKTVERFNPKTNEWDSSVAEMKEKRANSAAVVFGGKIYVIGGHEEDEATDDVERYNPQKNKWEKVEELEHKRAYPAAVVYDGKIYVIGGVNHKGDYIKQTEVFDPDGEDEKWHEVPDMDLKLHRSGAQALNWQNGILLIGGLYRGPLSTMDLWTEDEGWNTVADLHTARSGLQVVSIKDRIFAIGGAGFDDAVPTIEAWSSSQLSYLKSFDMPNPREELAAAAFKDAVYLFGGQDKSVSKLVEKFTPEFDTAVKSKEDIRPSEFILLNNYPNPFSGATTFHISGSKIEPNSEFSIMIYNVLGRVVAKVSSASQGRETDIVWQAVDQLGTPLPAGIYFARLVSDGFVTQKKIMIGR